MHPQSGQPSSGSQGGGAGAAGGNQGGPGNYGIRKVYGPYNAPEQRKRSLGNLEAREWDEFEKRYWLD